MRGGRVHESHVERVAIAACAAMWVGARAEQGLMAADAVECAVIGCGRKDLLVLARCGELKFLLRRAVEQHLL